MWRMLSPWREVPDPMWRSLIPMWKSLSPRGGGEVAVPWEDTIPGGLVTSRPPLAVAIPAVPPSPSSRPQFSVCLTVIFLLQLAAGALGFVFSDGVRPWGGDDTQEDMDPRHAVPSGGSLVTCPLAGAREGERGDQRGHRALPGRPRPAEPHRLRAEGGAGGHRGDATRPQGGSAATRNPWGSPPGAFPRGSGGGGEAQPGAGRGLGGPVRGEPTWAPFLAACVYVGPTETAGEGLGGDHHQSIGTTGTG